MDCGVEDAVLLKSPKRTALCDVYQVAAITQSMEKIRYVLCIKNSFFTTSHGVLLSRWYTICNTLHISRSFCSQMPQMPQTWLIFSASCSSKKVRLTSEEGENFATVYASKYNLHSSPFQANEAEKIRSKFFLFKQLCFHHMHTSSRAHGRNYFRWLLLCCWWPAITGKYRRRRN